VLRAFHGFPAPRQEIIKSYQTYPLVPKRFQSSCQIVLQPLFNRFGLKYIPVFRKIPQFDVIAREILFLSSSREPKPDANPTRRSRFPIQDGCYAIPIQVLMSAFI
jgi:hypothetical protein